MARGGAGDRKGERRAHQNRVKYDPNRYKNEKDKLSQDILFTMTSLCCRRCCDIIRWKADYGKYIPLDRPRKCNRCEGRTIVLAYHHICQPCAEQLRLCAKCQKSPLAVASHDSAKENGTDSEDEGEPVMKVSVYAFVDDEPLEEQLKPLRGLDVRVIRKKLHSQLAAEENERLQFLRERERRTVMRKAKGSAPENQDEQEVLDSDEELI